jgi:hypothetical protein
MSKRRKVAIGSFILIVAIVIVIARVVMPQLNQPVSGAIKTTDSTAQAGYSINLTPKKVSGTYISFNYPAGLTPSSHVPVIAPDLEDFTFTARDTTSWLLAVDVSMPRGATLKGDSGYTYRQNNPAIYQQSLLSVNNQSVIVMTDKTASFNKVAYVMHGPLEVSVALSGGDAAGTQPLQTSFMMVLNSLRWL